MIIIKRKVLTGLLVGSLSLLCFTSGVIASGNLTKITAFINSAITVEFKGKDLNLTESKPITYQDTTYLPLRTIAEATGLIVTWNQQEQRVYLTEKEIAQSGERKTFSKDSIETTRDYFTDLLLNPKDIPFTNKQINEMIMVTDINSASKGFTLTFPNDTNKVGVTFGSNVKDKSTVISYKVYDEDNNVLAMGKLNSNSTTFEEFLLSDVGAKVKFEFTGALSGKDTVYLIYDDSWYE